MPLPAFVAYPDMNVDLESPCMYVSPLLPLLVLGPEIRLAARRLVYGRMMLDVCDIATNNERCAIAIGKERWQQAACP